LVDVGDVEEVEVSLELSDVVLESSGLVVVTVVSLSKARRLNPPVELVDVGVDVSVFASPVLSVPEGSSVVEVVGVVSEEVGVVVVVVEAALVEGCTVVNI
jgi:hypothetical protein